MEKLLRLALLAFCLCLTEGQQTTYIVTTGSGSGDYFRSTGIRIIGSNQLVFQVKGSRDAILGLATEDRDSFRRWVIVLGGHNNTWDLLRFRMENQLNGTRECKSSSLSPTEYRTFWLSWDQSSIRLGVGDIIGDIQSCELTSTDTKIPTDFYLRLGSWRQNTIDWTIHLPTTTTTTTSLATSPITATTIPTTVKLPPRGCVVTPAAITSTAENVFSFGLCQTIFIILRLVFNYYMI